MNNHQIHNHREHGDEIGGRGAGDRTDRTDVYCVPFTGKEEERKQGQEKKKEGIIGSQKRKDHNNCLLPMDKDFGEVLRPILRI